eukprot:s1203_g13.t1
MHVTVVRLPHFLPPSHGFPDPPWGKWSPAPAPLCNGHQERHRSIVTLPQHGGKACDGPQKAVRSPRRREGRVSRNRTGQTGR